MRIALAARCFITTPGGRYGYWPRHCQLGQSTHKHTKGISNAVTVVCECVCRDREPRPRYKGWREDYCILWSISISTLLTLITNCVHSFCSWLSSGASGWWNEFLPLFALSLWVGLSPYPGHIPGVSCWRPPSLCNRTKRATSGPAAALPIFHYDCQHLKPHQCPCSRTNILCLPLGWLKTQFICFSRGLDHPGTTLWELKTGAGTKNN